VYYIFEYYLSNETMFSFLMGQRYQKK